MTLKKLLKEARKQGWAPVQKKKGTMWRSSDGKGQVMVHGTPSDYRAIENLRRDFKANGLDI